MPRQRHPTRDDALAAAVGVAFDLGLPAAAVAGRLGMRERAVAAHWPAHDDLVSATFSRIVGTELAETEAAVLAHPSRVRQLTALLETLAEPGTRLNAVWRESWSLGRRSPALGAAVRREQGAWHALVVAVARNGIASGDFAAVDADEVATHLLAVIDGVNAYALVDYGADIDRLRLLRAVARSYLGSALDDPAPGGRG